MRPDQSGPASVFNTPATAFDALQSDMSDSQGDSVDSPPMLAAEKPVVTEPALIPTLDIPLSIEHGIAAEPIRLDLEQASSATVLNGLKRKIKLANSPALGETESDLSDVPDDLSDSSEAQTLKKAKMEPTPVPVPIPVHIRTMRAKRTLHSATPEDIATEELVRALSSRRSTRIAKTKVGLANAAVVYFAGPSEPISKTVKVSKTRKSNANNNPTEKALARGSATPKLNEIPESEHTAGDVVITVGANSTTSIPAEATKVLTAPQISRGKATTRKRPLNRIAEPKKGTETKSSKIITLKLGSPALEQVLGLSPRSALDPTPGQATPPPTYEASEHSGTASDAHRPNSIQRVPSSETTSVTVVSANLEPVRPALSHPQAAPFQVRKSTRTRTTSTRAQDSGNAPLSSPISTSKSVSTPPRAPTLQFPLTPDDTPRREMVPSLDLSRLTENTLSPPTDIDDSQTHSTQMYPSPMYQPPVHLLMYEKRQQTSHEMHQSQINQELQQKIDLPQQKQFDIQQRQQLPTGASPLPVPQPAWPEDLLPQHVQQSSHSTREVLLGALSLHEVQPLEVPTERSVWPTDSRDHDMLRVCTRKLCSATDVMNPKPKPSSRPEVWADGRQELCETLQYFRAYHGGSYTTGGFARGFMFDKSAHARDYMDSTVVIARAGGGLVKDKDTGERVIGGDRSEDSKVASLRNSMQYLNPVVIITGADNPNAPTKPPHAYCVLDYFKPTHIWSEKSNGKIILRYRFEKLDVTMPSWWAQDQIEHGSLDPPLVHKCTKCNHNSQQIYLQGWMCLQPTCSMFWLMAPTATNPIPHEPVEADLEYDPCFLKQRVRWPNDKHVYSLCSNNAELSGLSIVGEDCSLAYWLGMVCPQCGRCNSRLSWTGWECGNTAEGCTWRREPPHTFIPAQSLRDPFFPLTAGYTLSRDTHLPLVGLDVSFKDNYRINKYTIPGVDGFVAHLIANKTVVEEEGGPDQMFEELQREDIGLRRRGLGSGMLKGESYTRHFLVNYGMPYKFIAATASRPFDGAARPINHTRTRLNWAAKSVLAETAARLVTAAGADEETARTVAEGVRQNIERGWKEKEFNEVLALGYFEQQRINYHDDGEFGLGPTIATLSLGAPGTMRLRMKARHFNGVSSAGVYDDTPPLPGCAAYEARLAAASSLSTLKAANSVSYRARLKTLPKELKLKSGGSARDAITLNLAHGDIVIMHGAQMQKYYEHSVDHAGKLRFALTCRYIEPGSLKEADRPDYEVRPDEGEYDGSRLPAAG